MCYRNEGYEVRGKRCGDERRRQPAARVRNYWIGLVASSELACVRGPWRGAACKAARLRLRARAAAWVALDQTRGVGRRGIHSRRRFGAGLDPIPACPPQISELFIDSSSQLF